MIEGINDTRSPPLGLIGKSFKSKLISENHRIMIYVSIPVHTSIPTILNQIENIQKHLHSHIVLHVSANADFSKQELMRCIREKKYSQPVSVNPVSVSTVWGGIIKAHLENIKFIGSLTDEPNAKVVFHSSNDMVVKKGLTEYLEGKNSLFNLRYIDRPGHWWPGNVALGDFRLTRILAKLGSGRVVASQIEGSMYPLRLLTLISDLIEQENLLDNNLFYPREEIFFSSIAYALGERPEGDPYIFSEVHRFDYVNWKVWNKIDKIFPSMFREFAKKGTNFLLFRSKFYKIRIGDVFAVRRNLIKSIDLRDGDNNFFLYKDPAIIFGVKRVGLSLDDPIRQAINKLD